MAVARVASITLDCSDPAELATFWNGLLGGEIVYRTDEFIVVQAANCTLTMMQIPDHRPATWPSGEVPKQIHLDLAVDDLEAAVAEAVDRGAELATEQFLPEVCRVLIDPAGHPFCLSLSWNRAHIDALLGREGSR